MSSMSIDTVHHPARARYLAVLDWSFALFSTMRLLTYIPTTTRRRRAPRGWTAIQPRSSLPVASLGRPGKRQAFVSAEQAHRAIGRDDFVECGDVLAAARDQLRAFNRGKSC